jgi:arsenate reductase
MAEAFLKTLGGDHYEVESAGFTPTTINPLVVEVMKEEGIDLSEKKTQSVFSLVKAQKFYGYVITVCNRAKETECPIFPGRPIRIHWDLENPEDYTGTHEEKLNKVRKLKNQIKELIVDFIK